MAFEFDTTSLLLGLLFSAIGLGYYIYGKRQQNPMYRYSGIALMFYPYIVSGSVSMTLVGVVLMLLPRIL